MTLNGTKGISRAIGLFLAAVLVLVPVIAQATPAKEAPWLPEAAAYRLTLFLGNLEPMPWDKIEAAWTKPHAGSTFIASAMDRLHSDSAVPAHPVLEAIAAQDRALLFAAATRTLASRLLEQLDRAGQSPGTAAAQRAIGEAQELYRAFADAIAAADPDASRDVGRAWLQLASAAGSAGVLGAGGSAFDEARFSAARDTIESYVRQNYLPDAFAARATFTALPESAIRNGTAIPVPAALPPGSVIANQVPLPMLVLNFEEQGIDETDLPLIAFGDMLFDSPQIFGGPARELALTCSTCHNRSDINNRLFIPGASHQPGAIDVDGAFFNPMFNDHRDDPIDIPSLRGLRFTGPYGRDGRSASLRDFTRNVIVNEFAGAEPTPFMLDALVAYITEFDFLPNPMLTPEGRLTELASDDARRGETIFNQPFEGMDGKSCASCHTPTGNFLDRQAHDIGSAEPAYPGGAFRGV